MYTYNVMSKLFKKNTEILKIQRDNLKANILNVKTFCKANNTSIYNIFL